MTVRKYDLPEMQRYVDALDKQISAISTIGFNIRVVAQSVLSSYKGVAAGKYAEAHDSWQKSNAHLIDELKSHRHQVSVAHQNYSEAEAANAAMQN